MMMVDMTKPKKKITLKDKAVMVLLNVFMIFTTITVTFTVASVGAPLWGVDVVTYIAMNAVFITLVLPIFIYMVLPRLKRLWSWLRFWHRSQVNKSYVENFI